LGDALTKLGRVRMGGDLRVVRIVPEYSGRNASYGLQPVYYNLSTEQARRGHDVHVIARRHTTEPGQELIDGVNVHRVGQPFSMNALNKLSELTRTETPAVIHTHSTSGVFLVPVKRALKAPVVAHVHGTTYSAATPAVLRYGEMVVNYSRWRVTTSFMRERALWSASDRIAAVSSSVRADLVSRYGIAESKIDLVYNGVDTNLFRSIPGSRLAGDKGLEGKKIVLYVGHFGLRKGIHFLIRAMKSVTREVPDSVLVCVGGVPAWLPKEDYWTSLHEQIQRNDLKGKVLLFDRVPNQELPEYYSMSSVLVLPSYYEAFPKVLIEAMACERPVITSLLGGTGDSVVDGVNGYLVPYANPDALSKAIVTILQDEKLAKGMGELGRERVIRDFTWRAVAERVDRAYEEVLAA
jgi:glycosyltransferase involved in cell wall biosynthesis